MTAKALEALWARRRHRIQVILDSPHLYHACDQCRSLVFRSSGLCQFCGAYRFNDDEAILASTAQEMLKTPYPFGEGVPPRISPEVLR